MTKNTITTAEIKLLNEKFSTAHPIDVIRWAVEAFNPDVALSTSFGAKSAGMIHMAIQVDPKIRINFVDTGFHFTETLEYKDALTKQFQLNLKVFHTKMDVEKFKKEYAHLPIEHPDYCCGNYKVEAMERALEGLRCWITGISRSDSATRENAPIVDLLDNGVVKVAPLATWTPKTLHEYMTEHNLSYHPLWYKGYASIGCYPCTQKPIDPNDARSGRWAGQSKTECGIHDIGKNDKSSK